MVHAQTRIFLAETLKYKGLLNLGRWNGITINKN